MGRSPILIQILRKDVGTVAEVLPFVQAGIPEQGYGVGVRAGKKGSDESPDSGAFAGLMAQYAPDTRTNPTERTDNGVDAPEGESSFADLRGGAVQSSPAMLGFLGFLGLLASLKADTPAEASGGVGVPEDDLMGPEGKLLEGLGEKPLQGAKEQFPWGQEEQSLWGLEEKSPWGPEALLSQTEGFCGNGTEVNATQSAAFPADVLDSTGDVQSLEDGPVKVADAALMAEDASLVLSSREGAEEPEPASEETGDGLLRSGMVPDAGDKVFHKTPPVFKAAGAGDKALTSLTFMEAYTGRQDKMPASSEDTLPSSSSVEDEIKNGALLAEPEETGSASLFSLMRGGLVQLGMPPDAGDKSLFAFSAFSEGAPVLKESGTGGKPVPPSDLPGLREQAYLLQERPMRSLSGAEPEERLPAEEAGEGTVPALEDEGLGEPVRLRRGGTETDQDSGRDGTSRRRSRTAANADRSEGAEDLSRSPARGEARPDVQSFFDGILASRRQLQPVAAPLDLGRGAFHSPGEVLREGLENVVRFARVNGEQRASLIVDPPALGRLSVELTSGTSGLEASIKVSSEQVRNLVQDQIVQLRMSLAQQGVQLTHFSVDVQQDDGRRQQGFGRGQSRRRPRGGGAVGDDEAAPTAFRVDLNEGLLHWVG